MKKNIGNGDIVIHGHGILPKNLSIGWIKPTGMLSAPPHNLLFPIHFRNLCRCITGAVTRRTPDLFARVFVQGNETGIRLATNLQQNAVFIHQWGGRITPGWILRIEILQGIAVPDNLASGKIQTMDISHRTKGINLALMNRGRCPGAIAIVQLVVWCVVSVLPKQLAAGAVQAKHPFRILGLIGFIHHQQAVLQNGNATIPSTDWHFPKRLRILWETLWQLGFMPDTIACWATPLGPIRGLLATYHENG